MIELVSADRCVTCDVCVAVCPTNVFDSGPAGLPVIARQGDCQTCFMCEAHCPADALFVAPQTAPVPADSPLRDEAHLAATGLLGSYRREIGWGRGRRPGARLAVGPALPPGRITPAGAR
ncbi:ferredoxin [Pilimelia anulata]|uniref:Ferredoxin n=1 Tax=Pilimelia anulata TaxID=53371 RepID=A0A8J3F6F3_9ACTN|nr:ferredoxin family protein [Pilimelia anulata]GGJ79856.1 ferredoxin [Pilimelia anulata]